MGLFISALGKKGGGQSVLFALKGETVPDSLPATPNSPPTRRGPQRGTSLDPYKAATSPWQ